MIYDFILNPQARSGRGELIWSDIEPELKKRRIEYKVYKTTGKCDGRRIAREITADGEEHTLVVLGGDGTINEVVNGIVHLEKVTLGYIPIGSSNDFARGVGIPSDPGKALEIVLSPSKILPMDVGVLKRDGKERRFAVSSGMGFDAVVCHEVCVTRWKRLLNMAGLGRLVYVAVALRRLIKDKPVTIEITTDDGERRVFKNAYFAAFMNLPYEGGGFRFCPEASFSDGRLDVMVASDISKLKIILLLPTAYSGRHVGVKGITLLRCRSASVRADRPVPLHTDGEPVFLRRKIKVGLSEEQMKVIAG